MSRPGRLCVERNRTDGKGALTALKDAGPGQRPVALAGGRGGGGAEAGRRSCRSRPGGLSRPDRPLAGRLAGGHEGRAVLARVVFFLRQGRRSRGKCRKGCAEEVASPAHHTNQHQRRRAQQRGETVPDGWRGHGHAHRQLWGSIVSRPTPLPTNTEFFSARLLRQRAIQFCGRTTGSRMYRTCTVEPRQRTERMYTSDPPVRSDTKAILLPSGAQAGEVSWAGWLVRFWRPEPSALTRWTS